MLAKVELYVIMKIQCHLNLLYTQKKRINHEKNHNVKRIYISINLVG